MKSREEIINDVKLVLKDNKNDMIKATYEDDYEEQAFCKGIESGIHYMLNLYDISLDELKDK